MASVKGIIVEIGGDTSGLQNALKKVNSSTASLSKELKGVNSLLKLDPKNTELVSQKQTVLKKNIEDTENKLKLLHSTYQRAVEEEANGAKISEENWRNIQREIINTENKLKQLKLEASKWTQAGRSIEEFGNRITNISNKLDKMGTTLTTRLTIPIAGIAVGLVNASKDFETAFTGVKKTVDGTAEQMAKIKQGIKDMSEEIPASTTEISAVAEAAGQLGIETDNVLKFTKTMINMGNATNLSADEAATTLARFANVTRMSQSDFDKLGSVIVALGNNFATTEAEIAQMGMNLASAGTQVGMTQSDIMALATALSSVGLEAQAGGTAFSKVMINMQLAVEKGGKDLKNFASVAGMSTKQFQKAFKEDATKAIMQFVDGLSKSGERGKSAIRILDDMGITETRLRDALLRSANASNVMNEAIELGNKAWEENTALTNEADKRYQTLDSRMEMTKNKIKNVATNTGDKLTPSFNKLLNRVDSLIDKFDGLNEEETENILKIFGLVAAIGPAVKMLGVFGNGIGNVTKGVGTFSQAVAVAKNNTTSSIASVNNLATAMKFLASPVGVATLATTAAAGAMIYFATKETEAQKEAKELAMKMHESKEALEQYNEEIDKTTNANLAHINSAQKLKDELVELVDENGKVKEGYRSRVDFILNELNSALGTEYKLNGDIIQNYKDLQSEIDKTIEKKKAEIILSSEEEKYKNAIENQKNAVEELKNVQEKLGMSYDEVRRKYGQYIDKMNNNTLTARDVEDGIGSTTDYKKIQELAKLSKGYEDAEARVRDYNEKIKQYEDNYAKYTEGKYTEISNTIKSTTEDWTSKTLEEINNSISEQSNAMQQYKTIYERTKDEVAKQNSEQAEENLNQLIEELYKRTSTIEKLGENETLAWKNIANNNYEEYSKKLNEIPQDTRKKIEETTGVIATDTELVKKTSELASEMTVSFNNNAKGEEAGQNFTKGVKIGLANPSEVEAATKASGSLGDKILQRFKDVLGIHSPSKEAENAANFFIDGFTLGLARNEKNAINSIKELATGINEELFNNLKFSTVKDFGKLQGRLSNQIIDSTKTIFTTPQIVFNVQELDEARLEQCFNYINRKYGSNY